MIYGFDFDGVIHINVNKPDSFGHRCVNSRQLSPFEKIINIIKEL